jgi:hypothetical protein
MSAMDSIQKFFLPRPYAHDSVLAAKDFLLNGFCAAIKIRLAVSGYLLVVFNIHTQQTRGL